MNGLVLLVLVVVGLLGWTVYWRFSEQADQVSSLKAYGLRFPRGLETEAVVAFIGGLSGLLPPWWKRWLFTPVVIFENVASADGIEHRVLVASSHAHQLENMLQAHLPGVRYTPLDDVPEAKADVAASYRLNTGDRQLRVDAPVLSTALLTALQPLSGEELVTVQWVLTPAGPVSPARHRTSAPLWWWSFGDDGRRQDAEAVSALKAKQASPLLVGSLRIGVQADGVSRARMLLRRTDSTWHVSRSPGVHLCRRVLPERWVARSVRSRSLPLFAWPLLCNAEELSGLIGFPVEAEQIPGLVLGGCRQLAASPLVPTHGIVLARSTFPGSDRPIAMSIEAQLRHVHAIGPTGVGKSTLLLNMIRQDLLAGHGVTVLDPKGDLVADVLARVPKGRVSDVIVFDASDDLAPVGLNPLRATGANRSEVMVENLVGIMHSLWRFSWGPRTDDILRAALMTLAKQPGMTLVEVPPLLLEDSFRRRFLGKLDDPVGLESFWGWYQGLSDAERATVVAAPLNKLRAFTMRPRIRRILGQSNPRLDMSEVINCGKILLVNLASGLLGDDAAGLVGALVLAELWHATTARSGMPADMRRLHVAYLDEFQHFLHLPTPAATVLAEARGLGLGLVLAHQHLHQLPTDICEAVLANARSRVVFQCASRDAKALSKELSSTLTADDLQGLGPYEIVAQVYAAGSVQPPCTGATTPPSEPISDAAAICERSRRRYGQPVEQIDAQIRSRTTTKTKAPVGSTTRSRNRRPRQGATS